MMKIKLILLQNLDTNHIVVTVFGYLILDRDLETARMFSHQFIIESVNLQNITILSEHFRWIVKCQPAQFTIAYQEYRKQQDAFTNQQQPRGQNPRI